VKDGSVAEAEQKPKKRGSKLKKIIEVQKFKTGSHHVWRESPSADQIPDGTT